MDTRFSPVLAWGNFTPRALVCVETSAVDATKSVPIVSAGGYEQGSRRHQREPVHGGRARCVQ
eukprot:32850-Chlamydomonas_euryale.AAC.1